MFAIIFTGHFVLQLLKYALTEVVSVKCQDYWKKRLCGIFQSCSNFTFVVSVRHPTWSDFIHRKPRISDTETLYNLYRWTIAQITVKRSRRCEIGQNSTFFPMQFEVSGSFGEPNLPQIYLNFSKVNLLDVRQLHDENNLISFVRCPPAPAGPFPGRCGQSRAAPNGRTSEKKRME